MKNNSLENINLLKRLIGFQSTDKTSANLCIEYCDKWLTLNGVITEIIENQGYKILIARVGFGNKKLIFNGHVDVVPATLEQFTPVEKNGRVYGRGAVDMKAGVASMMCAMVELKNKPLNSIIELQLVTDEESGVVECSKYLADNGHRGDFVICGEPTQLDIAVQAKGVLQLDITVHGKSAHGSRPWQGDNAILKAYKLYESLSNLPFTKESCEFYCAPSITISKIQAGDVYNKIPDICVISLDIRFLPTQSKEQILSQFIGLGINREDLIIHSYGEPVKTDSNNIYVRQLKDVVQRKTLKEVLIFGQHGSADNMYFSKYGIPAVEFGPAGANWHGDEEYVDIESMLKYKDILVSFAKDF